MNSKDGFFPLVLAAMLLIMFAETGSCQVADNTNSTIKILNKPLHSGRIDAKIYGGFIELLDDLVPGMRAEMLNDRNFEGVEKAAWSCDTMHPFNGARSARLTCVKNLSAVLSQSNLAVKKGMKYHFEGCFRTHNAKAGIYPLGYLVPEQPPGSFCFIISA